MSSNGSGTPLVAESSSRTSTCDLGHAVAGVVHDDLLGQAGAGEAVGEHPRLRRGGGAEPHGDALAPVDAAEGLHAVHHQPAAAHGDLGSHLLLAGDVLVDVGADHAPTRHHEAAEAPGVAHSLVGGERHVDGGVVRERVHEDEQLAVATGGDAPRERPGRRHGGAAGGGGPSEVAGELVLDGDLAPLDLDDRAEERCPQQVGDAVEHAAAGGQRNLGAGWGHVGHGGRGVRHGRGGALAALLGLLRARRRRRDRARQRGDGGGAGTIGGVGDHEDVVAEAIGVRAGGAVPGGRQRGIGSGRRHGDARLDDGPSAGGRHRRPPRRGRGPRRGAHRSRRGR